MESGGLCDRILICLGLLYQLPWLSEHVPAIVVYYESIKNPDSKITN
jgi:hypothetical protein